MKNIKILSILLSLFILSCSEQGKVDYDVIQVDFSKSQPLNLAEMVKSISVIPLETNDSCLIKRIVSMQVQDGMMYINNDRNEVMLFDKYGKFVRSTHSLLGQGPEDYTGAPSMYIDEKGTISIYEDFIPRIREYDKNLHLTRSYNVNVPDSTRSAMEWRCHAKLTDDVYIINDSKDFYFYSVKQEKVLETIHFDYPDLIGITSLFRLARYI